MSVRGFDPSAIPVVGRTLDRLTTWDEAVRRRWPFSALVGPDLEPGAVEGDGTRLLVRPAILGFIAVSAIMLGSIPQGSPFVLKLPGAWFFGVPAAGTTTQAPLNFLGLIAMYGGLVLFMRVWYGLIRTLSQVKGVPVRKLVMVLASLDRPLAPGAAAVQPRHLQLRGAGRDDEPPHQPIPLRPRRPRRHPVGVVGRSSVAQHPGALRAAVHGDRRLPHQRVGSQRARRPRPAAAAGPGRRRPHGHVHPVAGAEPGTRSVIRLHHGRAQSGHDPASGGGCPQRCPHARPAHGRPGRGASRETGGGHRAVRAGRGGEGPGRAGRHLHRLGLDGHRVARARPNTARGHRRPDRVGGDGRACRSSPVSAGAGC